MEPLKKQLVRPLGEVIQLSPTALNSPNLRKKLDAAMKTVNEKRNQPLNLVELISATKQVINGIKYVFQVKLREDGDEVVKDYKIGYLEMLGEKSNVQVTLQDA